MLISIVNFTSMPDAEVLPVVRAVNRQMAEDFNPFWNLNATLRLTGRSGTRPAPNEGALPVELRGDAILYLYDGEPDVEGAVGYHDQTAPGVPYGFVFTKVAAAVGEDWSVTLSHESLELLGDANVNQLAMGPHPGDPTRTVFHWFEMCDAVQDERYLIDGVAVSNFVLPLYFTPSAEAGARNDFLGNRHGAETLPSFGISPGGYVGFFDPATGKHETFSLHGDKRAAERLAIKRTLGVGGRPARHTRPREIAEASRSHSLRASPKIQDVDSVG